MPAKPTMKVKLQPPNAQDKFYLIKMDAFMSIVDQWDLAQRESQTIEDAYHEYWFSGCSNGCRLFHAPEFYLEKGIAKFINGRHRTLVLSRHLEEAPMALTNMDNHSEITLQNISIRALTGDEVFDFPDLPHKYLGYDTNIGK